MTNKTPILFVFIKLVLNFPPAFTYTSIVYVQHMHITEQNIPNEYKLVTPTEGETNKYHRR